MIEDHAPEPVASSTSEPVQFDRRSEVAALWDADETVAGDVWRRIKEGKTPQEIADEDGITVGPIYSSTNLHNALVQGTVSSSPSVARGVAGRVRKWLKTKTLSPELRVALEQQEQLLNAVVNDSQASEAESEKAIEKSKAAEGGEHCWHLRLHASPLREASVRPEDREDAPQGRALVG